MPKEAKSSGIDRSFCHQADACRQGDEEERLVGEIETVMLTEATTRE